MRRQVRIALARLRKRAELGGVSLSQKAIAISIITTPAPRNLDVSRAKERVGFEARVGLEEGLRATVESFRESLAVG